MYPKMTPVKSSLGYSSERQAWPGRMIRYSCSYVQCLDFVRITRSICFSKSSLATQAIVLKPTSTARLLDFVDKAIVIEERGCTALLGRVNDLIGFAHNDALTYIMSESLIAIRLQVVATRSQITRRPNTSKIWGYGCLSFSAH